MAHDHSSEQSRNHSHGNDVGGDPFDEKALTWDDDPAHVERAKWVAARIAELVPLDQTTRLLEYGAGTGLVSEFLADRVGEMTLADTSVGMRNVIAQKIIDGRLANASVWDLDLSTSTVPTDRFDLIVTVLTLHHLDDLESVLSGFAQMLNPGGHLCVVDLDAEDGSFHGEGFGGHHGFERGQIKALVDAAGFLDVDVVDCGYIQRDDGTYPMFLAVGVRGVAEV